MNKDLIVKLFVPTKGNHGRIGTAYPVAKDVLMTAAHVVGDAKADTIEAQWWYGDKKWHKCTKIHWDGRPKHDVILLGCKFPNGLGQWGHLSSARPVDHKLWTSEGFSKAGERNEAGRNPIPLKGSMFSTGSDSPTFQLEADAPVVGDKLWQGASGCPVFVDDKIMGVIAEIPQHFGAARLTATATFKLLLIDTFRALVIGRGGEEALAQLKSHAAQALANSADATRILANALQVDAKGAKSMEERCVDKLIQLHAVDLLRICLNALIKSELKNEATARAIDDICLCLLPAVYGIEAVSLIREFIANSRAQIVSIPAGKETVFEVYMAAVDGRRMRMKRGGVQLRPEEALLHAEAENGPLPNTGELEYHIHRKLLGGEGIPSEAQVQKLINRLKDDLEFERYRHYYVYQTGIFTRQDVQRLRDKFENQIVFLEMEKDETRVEEDRIFYRLEKLLTRQVEI